MAYTGPIYFTDQFQGEGGDSEFVYDTGSGVLTTTSVDCISGCETSYYDQSRSTTAVTISANDSVLRYGSATLQGKYVQDTTCVAAYVDECVENFEFFKILSATGFGFDGILGMSPYGS